MTFIKKLYAYWEGVGTGGNDSVAFTSGHQRVNRFMLSLTSQLTLRARSQTLPVTHPGQ